MQDSPAKSKAHFLSLIKFVSAESMPKDTAGLFSIHISTAMRLSREQPTIVLACAACLLPPLERTNRSMLYFVDDTRRLSRKIADSLQIVEQLKFSGIRVVDVSQGIDTDSEQLRQMQPATRRDSLHAQG